jgi:hypothetical protein
MGSLHENREFEGGPLSIKLDMQIQPKSHVFFYRAGDAEIRSDNRLYFEWANNHPTSWRNIASRILEEVSQDVDDKVDSETGAGDGSGDNAGTLESSDSGSGAAYSPGAVCKTATSGGEISVSQLQADDADQAGDNTSSSIA